MTLDHLLPSTAGNAYRDSRVALVAFALLTAVTLVRSAVHVFAPDGGAQSIAKPVETVGTAPGAIGNWLMIPVAVTLFVLSSRGGRGGRSGSVRP